MNPIFYAQQNGRFKEQMVIIISINLTSKADSKVSDVILFIITMNKLYVQKSTVTLYIL